MLHVVNDPWGVSDVECGRRLRPVRLVVDAAGAEQAAGDGEAGANFMNSQLIKMAAIVNGYDMGMFKSRVTNR
jgi:hypothetical protein